MKLEAAALEATLFFRPSIRPVSKLFLLFLSQKVTIVSQSVVLSSPNVSSSDNVRSPNISSQDVRGPEISSPDVSSPDVSSQDIISPDISCQDVSNQDILS